MAPAAAVAFSIIVGANFAAGALPLSVLFALVGCLLVAVSIGQLAKQLPSAGGFYTYAARGLHPAVGFLVGWGYAFVDATVGLRSPVMPAQVGRGVRWRGQTVGRALPRHCQRHGIWVRCPPDSCPMRRSGGAREAVASRPSAPDHPQPRSLGTCHPTGPPQTPDPLPDVPSRK